MNKETKTILTVGGGFLILLTVLLLMAQGYFSRHVEESPLYRMVSAYAEGQSLKEDVFAADSGEAIFLKGLEAYTAEEYQRAETYFEAAMEEKGGDPALSAYLYYYRNQCVYALRDRGSYELVAKTLDAAAQYAPLANDTQMLWNLIESISLSSETDGDALLLLQEYLQEAENLELATWAWVKNCIALLEYNNGEYAKSIRGFYDVELALENTELTPAGERELHYAREYIANIYYIFEDYETAAELYQELIDSPNREGTACHMNLASAYLDAGEPKKARNAMEQLEEELPLLSAEERSEVEASRNDVLANICMAEGNYADADRYLKEAEAFYQEREGDIYLGADYFIMLSRCKYLVHEGEMGKAQRMLENMAAEGEAAYYGLENEIYELLKEIYEKTEQTGKLVGIYETLLALDQEFTETIQREYLEFSEYYRDVNQLEKSVSRLSRANTIAICMILMISAALVTVLYLIRLLHKKNVTDQLTGIYNRKKLNHLMNRWQRSGTPAQLGVVMMDIDYFKRYNDTYGHPAGDEVLKKVAKALTSCVRSKDIVIRYGGEEFLLLLTDVQPQIAEAVCQRIQEQMKQCAIAHIASDVAAYVTLSMGLCYQEQAGGASLAQLIECADQCLYRSKESGRNCYTAKTLRECMESSDIK